ncbi:nucleotide exchange factor GrpE [Nosocomiicoccus ampullae]|uniref:Protein GrpE n=1 Tax=Nosocomiicoccus ampullae TaxID=489910 RepID=A0A9Q2HG84_9STAP|nr:nucleotide exchange factor GrpE [Nosocomiicoccus ampullae]MBB5176561.1 molecular chaperone GrpE [Nosocomiicoccus ampullae]QYA47538.1 nucleotide exchange factor GrpE [Nosocomiicoccus ampullae]
MEKKNETINEEELKETEDTEEENTLSEETEETIEDSNSEEVEEEKDPVELLEEKLEKEENKYLKLYAEFENYKRRSREEAERNNKYKNQSLATDLLSVLDNLERALQETGDSESFESLHKGVEMVYKDFLNKLEVNGITQIQALDEPFDPNYHQAVMAESKDGVEAGIVIEELQKGYLLKDRVIRPSMVKVSE